MMKQAIDLIPGDRIRTYRGPATVTRGAEWTDTESVGFTFVPDDDREQLIYATEGAWTDVEILA